METMEGYLNINFTKFIYFVLIETIRMDYRTVISVGGKVDNCVRWYCIYPRLCCKITLGNLISSE